MDKVTPDIKRNPEAIWLSPICDENAHHGDGRSWAAPAPDDACDGCGEPWVRYVREDLATPAPDSEKLREAKELVEELGRLKAICDQAVADGFGADHKLIILANYGGLALKLAPRLDAALGASL